jgi:ABC-type nitrate/sulfonate/bicarbonate transport system permease component
LENSTDGQTALVYVFILVYAAFALVAIRLVDAAVRRFRRTSSTDS